MNYEEHLTIEGLSELYDNRFELVNRAINLAVDKIRSGRGPRIQVNCQNISAVILAEMRVGQGYLDTIGEDLEGDEGLDNQEDDDSSNEGKKIFRAHE